jgi:hypothetical protein
VYAGPYGSTGVFTHELIARCSQNSRGRSRTRVCMPWPPRHRGGGNDACDAHCSPRCLIKGQKSSLVLQRNFTQRVDCRDPALAVGERGRTVPLLPVGDNCQHRLDVESPSGSEAAQQHLHLGDGQVRGLFFTGGGPVPESREPGDRGSCEDATRATFALHHRPSQGMADRPRSRSRWAPASR